MNRSSPPPEVSGSNALAAAASEFAIKRNRAYLNNASIGPCSKRVLDAVTGFLRDVEAFGRNNYPNWCRYADHVVKAKIARLIGAKREEIAFVKNTTEGILIVANGLDWREGDNVIVPTIEYPSNVYCWMNLARRGVEVRWYPARDGRLPAAELEPLIDSRTRLVTLSAVQFSNGFRQDLAATSEICRRRGVLLNLDAIQHVGALRLDVGRYRLDFVSVGGHKWLLGPIGSGFFYCRAESMNALHPANVGYHSVDKSEDHMDYELVLRGDAGRFEEALVNFPGIYGLDAALDMQLEIGPDAIERRILGLADLAVERLRSKGCRIASPLADGERSGIVCFRHPAAAAETLESRLAAANVDVAVRDGAIRVSPSFYNDEEEIERLVRALPDAR
jgi:selenocysteine lyase/cysteine desulfurase